MSDTASRRMTADAFLAWAQEQPEGQHFELCDGEVIAMAPECSGHALTKAHVWRRLAETVEAAGRDCDVYPDGMAVVVDDATVYEPDVVIRCGPRVPPDTVRLSDPVVIVEVLSPSTRGRDMRGKLIDYFRLPSLRHYVIVRPGDGAIIHHARTPPETTILTRIINDGTLHLDPPGITVTGLFLPPR
ncbi:Uma2 family endonuclease [Rhodopila sp.]|uniref:Uma2 family endonuclease n=1 Tax=Rhodopila sp. TaxID=2480087 RepID=UPI002D136676|nr:Uma2 family endonuclease [Rhodopila sp.]HVZ07800.1 Uma2 family endonuclease [Rhodopila sp.]